MSTLTRKLSLVRRQMVKDKIRGLSIFHRLLATFLSVIVVFGGVLVLAFYSFNRQSIERYTRERIYQQFESMEHEFKDEWQNELIASLKLLAANPVLDEFIVSPRVEKDIRARSVERLFRQYIRYMQNYKRIYFVDPLGRERITVDRTGGIREHRNLRESSLFRRLESTVPGTVRMEGPYRDQNGEVIVSLAIAKADPDRGSFGGVLIIDFSLKRLLDYLGETTIFGENPVWAIAPDGEVLKQPPTARGSFDPRPYMSPGHQKERNVTSLKGGMLIYEDMFIVPDQRFLRLAISIPSSLLLEDARWDLKFLSIVFILFLFLVSMVVFYLSKYFSMPIVELARVTAGHARGDHFNRVDIKTSGEVQLLVDSFNRMAEDLKKTTVSRDYVDNIIDSMQEVLIVLSPEGRMTRVNKAAVRLLGYEEKELMGRQMGMIIAGESSGEDAESEDIWKGYFSGNTEKTFLARDGRQIAVLFSAAMIWDNHNAFQGVVCVAQDIAELKKAEKELIEARRAAEESNRIKSEFLANMSHEIRTPMNGIIGMTTLALETDLTEEQRDYLGTIRRSANVLLDTINNILDFSKIEAGKLSLEVIQFNLRLTVEGVIDTLAPQASAKGLELACYVSPDVPSMLEGDPGKLRQILLNFGSNAVKFTHKGEVVIRVELEEEREDRATIMFSVTDTGIGIPRDKRGVIFDAFVQGDGSTTRLYGGTGLGLSITKNLAMMMGGKIGVESEVGRGSRFWFSATFAKQGEEDASPDESLPDLKDLRVLVVDDNETNALILAKMLARFGCRTEAAAGGADAIRTLKEASRGDNPFQLLFLDMQIPGMDGERTATIVRHTPGISTIPIIVLTSVGRRGEVSHLRDLGCDGYLIKPVRQSLLLDTIAAVMSIHEGNRNVKDKTVVTRHTIREKKLKGVKILLAEDNLINKKVALAVLKKEGYRVDTVENGFFAVEAAGRNTYDLILMDVQMPGMDGVEATRLIREKEGLGRHTVIIAMTAHAMSEDRDRCLAAGMDDYISKPLKPEDVFSVLGKWLKSKRDDASSHRQEGAGTGSEGDTGGSVDTIVDMESAMSRFGDDREFYRELIGDFLNYVPGKIKALEDAMRTRDRENIQSYAHSIKGAAGNLSARKVFSTALRIENKGSDGDLADVPLLIEELKSEIARLKEFSETLS